MTIEEVLSEIVKQADEKFAFWKPIFGPDCTRPDAVRIDWALIENARAALKGGETVSNSEKPQHKGGKHGREAILYPRF